MTSILEKKVPAVPHTLKDSAGLALGRPALASRSTCLRSPLNGETHWSWACRRIERRNDFFADENDTQPPRVGDLALVEVETVGFHQRLTTENNRRRRLYRGDRFVGVFGNRYAVDAFEAAVHDVNDLGLLTGVGMIGTVLSKHHAVADADRLTFTGFMKNAQGERLNLKELLFRQSAPARMPRNLVIVVGTGMNAGKTTTASKLIHALSVQGHRVVACKLTGSVSNHDPDELDSAAAKAVIDFSDYGFPSTYLCPEHELIDLFHTMLADVATHHDYADVVVMELADGLLQRETAMLLNNPRFKSAARGVILAAESAMSAICAVQRLQLQRYNVIAVSGKITSSPLATREFEQTMPGIKAVSSAGAGRRLAETVHEFLKRG